MLYRGSSFLCLCIMAMQLMLGSAGLPVDQETRAQMEAKVMSEMSLKHLEEMVENDDRVVNAPQSRIVIIPKPRNDKELVGELERDAIIIHRKPKKSYKKVKSQEDKVADHEAPKFRYSEPYFEPINRRSSYEPRFEFESAFQQEESFPSFFKIADDLESAGSSPAKQFYESIVESVLSKQKFGLASDPFEALDIAASEAISEYKPRFNYDAYSKDSTETKLQGKPYWKDAPERREEMVDENGCRTVIKKVVDPEDEKKSSSDKAKSVVITKECEYPSLNGPDAKILEGRPLRYQPSRYDSAPSSGFSSYEDEPSLYEKSRPEELNIKQVEQRDPLAPDYIDSMLEKHFKSFPGFSNPISSFKGYQERFKLRAPEAFKDVKPTVGVQTYEYSHPKSGFEDERQATVPQESGHQDSPRIIEHHYNYDYPENSPRKPESSEYDDESKQSDDGKDPKMMKKSFAYYRKDNPKSDPDDHQFAEEYAQGNYRSFSSSYDSEKDEAKNKKQQ